MATRTMSAAYIASLARWKDVGMSFMYRMKRTGETSPPWPTHKLHATMCRNG